jgi:hypothetical protein
MLYRRNRFVNVLGTVVAAGVILAQLRAQDQLTHWVSLITLIANPDTYNRKLVGTEGFLCLREEQNILYLHDEDYRHLILKNGVTLRLQPEQIRELREKNYHYVRVVGIFDAHGPGSHAASGTLTNIKRVETEDSVQDIPKR